MFALTLSIINELLIQVAHGDICTKTAFDFKYGQIKTAINGY
jgi:hypothetical protein